MTLGKTPNSAGRCDVTGLGKSFAGNHVLSDIDLRVDAGSLFTILGPSGCGKSTLLRIIAGLESQDRGVVAIDGVDHSRTAPHRRPTNLIFQDGALFPHLSVRGNVEFGLKAERLGRVEMRRRVGEAIEMVGLSTYARRMPHELSGGQRQRVAIARGLVKRPALLLLDEPLSALDLQLQIDLRRELHALQKYIGTTFVWVTHNQSEALEISDRIAVLDSGRVVQVGTPTEIWNLPETVMVAEFIGYSNLLPIVRHDGDEALLQGGWRARVGTGNQRGSRSVVVRPSHFTLTAGPSSGVAGEIVSAAFQGDHLIYHVAVAQSTRPILVTVPVHERQYAIGDLVSVQLGASELHTVSTAEPSGQRAVAS